MSKNNNDGFDDGFKKDDENALKPLNIIEKPERQTAIALKDSAEENAVPIVTAAGRGKLAEQILQIALENGIKIRTDADLAEMLAKIELDSPIPSEAFMAVAEVLSYLYKANGQANPFDAVLKDAMKKQQDEDTDTNNDNDNKDEQPPK